MTYTSLRLVFALALVLSSCSHAPVLHGPVQNYVGAEDRAEDWMSGDDYAFYVRRLQRSPSNKKVYKYKTTGTCGGFPRIDVKTAPGFCVGLVFDGGQGTFKKSRWAAPLAKNKVLIVDMGGWARNNGRIYVLDFGVKPAKLSVMLEPKQFPAGQAARGILDEPNQILKHTDGKFYVGGATGVYRFDPTASRPEKTVEVLIRDLPATGLHPLKSFTFDESNGFYVNVGSASNVCQNFTKFGDTNPQKNPRNWQRKQFANCPEVENMEIGQGQVRRYEVLADGRLSSNFTVFAKGLRNSIGLLWDPYRKVILQTENGRDAIGKFAPNLVTADLPHEEINVLQAGRHYGWPYCYDNNQTSPEWTNVDCAQFTKPQAFLPPHSAPLGAILHSGNNWPAWYKGRLLVALHGYEKKGHRIVAMKRDDQGLPTGIPQSLVYGWDQKGEQGVGKPTSMLELEDGSVLIVEDDDQNKILKLVYDPTQGDGQPVQEVDQAVAATDDEMESEEVLKKRLDDKLRGGNPPVFLQFQVKVIDKYCAECHQAAGSPGVRLIKYDDDGNALRIKQAGKAKELLEIIKGNPDFIPMPPQGWDTPAEQAEAVKLLEAWISGK